MIVDHIEAYYINIYIYGTCKNVYNYDIYIKQMVYK